MHAASASKAAPALPRHSYIRQVMRAGGPGGQHQNKTESAVRLIHKETGLRAESRSERSQAANFDLAMQLLVAKLAERDRAARAAAARLGHAARPRAAFGGTHVRSYVLDRDRRAVDHRTGVALDPAAALRGRIDPFLAAALRAGVA